MSLARRPWERRLVRRRCSARHARILRRSREVQPDRLAVAGSRGWHALCSPLYVYRLPRRPRRPRLPRVPAGTTKCVVAPTRERKVWQLKSPAEFLAAPALVFAATVSPAQDTATSFSRRRSLDLMGLLGRDVSPPKCGGIAPVHHVEPLSGRMRNEQQPRVTGLHRMVT